MFNYLELSVGIEPTSLDYETNIMSHYTMRALFVGRPRLELGFLVYRTSSLNHLADLPKFILGFLSESNWHLIHTKDIFSTFITKEAYICG